MTSRASAARSSTAAQSSTAALTGAKREPERLLVRGPNWVGDLVMATPGFRALRRRYPECEITLQVRPGLEPLVAGSPWFDRVLPVQSYHAGVSALWSEGRALRDHGFDTGLCIPDSVSSALLMRIAGVQNVVGFRRGGRGVLLHTAVDPPAEWGAQRWIARERFVLQLMQVLDCPPAGLELELHCTEDETASAEEILAVNGVATEDRRVLIAPGASFGPSKQWPAERFARVGDALTKAGMRVVVVGSQSESGLTRAVRDTMTAPAVDLGGRIGLGTAKALVRGASLAVCNDAGLRHMAVAFGVPCVVLMGPTSLEKTNLNLERVEVLTEDVDCRPCYQRHCPIDHRCMTGIGVDRVVRTALRAADGARVIASNGTAT